MVRKKQPVTPVVAKPLNDTTKRNLVTSFVTNDVKETVTNVSLNSNTEDVTKIVTENVPNSIIENDTITDSLNISEKVTNSVPKNSTKIVTKKVTITKRILLGKKEIVANFTSNNRSRPNYNLSDDTIEKIEKISDILGYKKAEFVDIYLNGTLTKVLNDLEKSNK